MRAQYQLLPFVLIKDNQVMFVDKCMAVHNRVLQISRSRIWIHGSGDGWPFGQRLHG
jgi:hypothetical protein